MTLRSYRPSDCAEMARLFYDTVHTVNARDYTPEQLDAWATGEVDLEAWNVSFLAHDTVVAEAGGTILGFGDMTPEGYLDRLYVHKDFQGRDVAAAICDALEGRCPSEAFTVHASITARPFFEKRGYILVNAQQVNRRGVTLTNFVMEKRREPEITLCPMTRELCHEFFRGFQNDPAIFMDMSRFSEYVYSPEKADAYFEKQQIPSRRVFLILADGVPVGEGKLKDIDPQKRECSLGIHLRDDSVKGRGYGTRAERLLLKYAFDELDMLAVNADAVLKNTRSQHVLEKVGFRFVGKDDTFQYYRCERKDWKQSALKSG